MNSGLVIVFVIIDSIPKFQQTVLINYGRVRNFLEILVYGIQVIIIREKLRGILHICHVT